MKRYILGRWLLGGACLVLWSCHAPTVPPVRVADAAAPPPAPVGVDDAPALAMADHDEPDDLPADDTIAGDSADDGSAQVGAADAAVLVDATTAGPRIGAIGYHVWIMPRPSHEGLALGKLRMGTSVALSQPEPVAGDGCARGWRAIEPRGYICLNRHTTLDLQDDYYRALHELAPDPTQLFPYRYVHSRGAPMYSRVPSPAEWLDAERRLGPPGSYQKLAAWARGHEELIEPDKTIAASDAVPWFFAAGKRQVKGGTRDPRRLVWRTIPNGSMLAYARAFTMHGRVWLVTPDLMLVPADRMQVMRRSTFQGVQLDDEQYLPIAFNRDHNARPLYRQNEDGTYLKTDKTIAGKGWLMIDSPRAGAERRRYFPVRNQPGVFVKNHKTLTISWPRTKLPRAIKPGQKWLDARILPGTLTAYEGLRPIYVTMFSPGKGGLPTKGLDNTKYATTQTGYFPLEWKERVATMSNEKSEPKVLWFSDVPNIQYLRAPLAMHVAYWHEDFGNRKSAECLNLSPRDGRWMFDFTDPPLPPDWGAVRPGGGNGRSTPIIVTGFQ